MDDMKPIIEMIQGQLESQIEGAVYRAVQHVGINVDKERLLQALKDARAFWHEGYEAGRRGKPAWISVEERLPEKYDKDPDWSVTVLFMTTQGHIHSGYRNVGRLQKSFYDDDWTPPYWLDESENLSFEEDEVTHWMPLPEPPEVEG